MRKYFGTDGIRGKVGDFPITPDFMLKLGWAAGRVLAKEKNNRVVIGKDTRVSGYMFESALEAGLSAAGVDILLLGPMPTPAIAHLTRTLHAQAGIVISASHNPYSDNGVKFFSAEGRKLLDGLEVAIEQQLEQPLKIVDSLKLGKAKRVDDAEGRYVEFCKSTVENQLDLSGLKIVLDCANGATYHVGPAVFQELGANVIKIACEPDGFNINQACGSTHLSTLQKAVLQHRATLGIAFDGDGDRVLMVDERGETLDGDELLFILAKAQKPSGVVGTLMTNYGVEVALRTLGIELIRASVGDRYVMSELEKHGWNLGAESSGHIICRDKINTGDAIVAALQVLMAMQSTGQSLHALKQGMQKYPQTMINVSVRDKQAVLDHAPLNAEIERVTRVLQERGRVLLRPSGTESVIRVMVEGENKKQVDTLAQELADFVEKELK